MAADVVGDPVQRNETDARAITIDVEVAAHAHAVLADALHRDLPRGRQIRRFGGMQDHGGDLRQFPLRETSTPGQVSGHDSYATIFRCAYHIFGLG
jgi:hypothetical protein